MEYANNIITTKWMDKKYKEFNALYFDSALNPMSNFIVSKKKSFLGQFNCRNWSIELSTYCYRSENAFINTMLHEMCHAYVRQNYGCYAKAHGQEWKRIANRITMLTMGKYGTIKRCGGGDAERPMNDVKSGKCTTPTKFMLFTDCYGYESIIKLDKMENLVEDFINRKAIHQNTDIYIVETNIPQYLKLPQRRSVRWNQTHKFKEYKTIKDILEYPYTILKDKYQLKVYSAVG